MDERAKTIVSQGNKLFKNKENLDSLWQELALNFYPERADFTDERTDGEEYADHLYTSYPPMARRELANLVATSLRPRSSKWFSIHTSNDELDQQDSVRAYLEGISKIQWRAMYMPRAGFIRATKQADHDFVAFGNAVIYVSVNLDGSGLLYRNYHLRDCAWAENAEGRIDCIYRKWKASAKKLVETFGNKVSGEISKAYEKDPHKTFPCYHAVLPSEMVPGESKGKYVSYYIEKDTEKVLEKVPLDVFPYVVPRWHTLDGTPYAVSMASSVCLPDGRTAQVISRTMLEAGEKYVDPPMLAFSDAIRGDIALYAGGITVADKDYDEKTGEVLRPISQDRQGYPIAESLSATIREDISNGFFLNRIQFPDSPGDMTAYETRYRIQEYMRAAAPIFEPIEQEYNDPVCNTSFELLMANGAFPIDEMPDELEDNEVNFSFRSPMSDMAEQQDAEIFVDAVSRVLAPVAQIDPAQWSQVNLDVATRDAMKAVGFKQKWLNSLDEIQEQREAMAAQAQAQAQREEAVETGNAQMVAAQGEEAVRELEQG